MIAFKHSFVKTPYGSALIGINEGRVCSFLFLTGEKEKILNFFHKKFLNSVEVVSQEFQEFADAIFKNRTKFLEKSVPNIVLYGTEFQKKVWIELAKLHEVISYQELAKRIGAEKSVRAVASAVAKNPIHYAIPCHLVIKSCGSIGKYAGGVELKQRLIADSNGL